MVVTTPLREQILRSTAFKGYEVLVKGVILKANFILLEMHDFDMILGMDWLSTHRASVDYFTKKIVFQKPRNPDLEFEGDRKILPTCVILALEAKRLLHKGCEAYLEFVIDNMTPEVDLDNVAVVREFQDVFSKDLLPIVGIQNWIVVGFSSHLYTTV